MFASNLHQFHSRKEKLLHLSWCNYPETLAFKIQDCIFLTVSKAYNCRARELGLGNVVSVSGLPKVVTPRESLGDNPWNISVLIQRGLEETTSWCSYTEASENELKLESWRGT